MADDGADHPQRIETFARYTFNCVPWFREFEHQLFGLARPIGIFACECFDARILGRRRGMVGHACPGLLAKRGRGSGRGVTSNPVTFPGAAAMVSPGSSRSRLLGAQSVA